MQDAASRVKKLVLQWLFTNSKNNIIQGESPENTRSKNQENMQSIRAGVIKGNGNRKIARKV